MEQLIAHLKHHHADVARCIVGSVAVDEHHLTEGQLLARAGNSTALRSGRKANDTKDDHMESLGVQEDSWS